MGRHKKAVFGPIGPQGRAVLAWLTQLDEVAVQDNFPLAHELASLGDGLGAVRRELAKEGLTILERTRLVNQETRLSAAFVGVWTALGLTFDSSSVTVPRPVGRPAESDRLARRK